MDTFDTLQLEEKLAISDIEKKEVDDDTVDGIYPEDNEDAEETVDAD